MKKAQIQNMESIAVIIIIGIMLIIGLVFAFNFKSEDVKKELEDKKSVQAFTIALRVSSLEELKCSSFEDAGNICLDLYLIQSFSEILKEINNQNTNQNYKEAYKYYYDQFKTSEVIIKIIYPPLCDSTQQNCKNYISLFNYTPEISSNKEYKINTITFPINVLNPVSSTYHFSIIEVRVHS